MLKPVIPTWKKWWSYLRPIVIEQTSSDLNPVLEVQLSRGRLMLCTEHAIYSYEDLYDNFSDTFRALDLESRKYDEVLILGLGLGSIPQILEQTFQRKYYYTCIELDEEVIVLAQKYILGNLKSGMDVVRADAAEWVYITEQTFDMVCVDIFVDDNTPSEFKTVEYLNACKHLINPEGVLIYNCLAYNAQDAQASQDFYKTVFQLAFPNSKLLKLRANYMLLGFLS